jgi:hypothetical protein
LYFCIDYKEFEVERKYPDFSFGRYLKLIAALAVVFVPVLISGQVITPHGSYSSPQWSDKAKKYHSNLDRIKKDLTGKYGKDELQLVELNESQSGGIGFWSNPGGTSPDARYLSVFVKTRIPPPTNGRPFNQETRTGRLLTIWDAYGKHIMKLFADELDKMNDGSLKGGALVIVYSKKSPGASDFATGSEGFALFVPESVVKSYARHRMTNQSLFSQSQMFGILEGEEQVSALYSLFYP